VPLRGSDRFQERYERPFEVPVKEIVLFDLGNTLVRYWERVEFRLLLEEAICRVRDDLDREGLLRVSPEEMWRQVEEENHESPDHRVRPLEGRLARIFRLAEPALPEERYLAMCRQFMAPLFSRGCLYEDTLPALDTLRAEGVRAAIISNTPWGSPAALWREELARLGLRDRVDAAIFCTDAGWRKPAREVFEFALARLGARAEQCLFVGDDPRWDLAGPRAVGIEAVLIDRAGTGQPATEPPIRNLGQVRSLLHL
jgi:putative hydrolase of the HAD superfamily